MAAPQFWTPRSVAIARKPMVFAGLRETTEYTRMRRRRRGKEVYASKMGENQLKINYPIRRLPQLGKPLGLLQNKCCQKKGPHNLFRSHKTGRNMGINYGSTYLETSPS